MSPLPHRLGRRSLLATGAGSLLLPLAGARAASGRAWRWQGTLLGTGAEVILPHPDRAEAEQVVAEMLDEVERLEQVFSLFRPGSEISRLNRDGVLDAPSHDLLMLVQHGLRLSRLTDGAFDITVQPLWRLHAAHFAQAPKDREGPPREATAEAMRSVGWRHVRLSAGRIEFARPGMAVTLNGLAQGYITDRVAQLLARRGFREALVSMGEHRALGDGPEPAGVGWRIGVRDPRQVGRTIASVGLRDRALATSGGYGTVFSADGRFHHLLSPATGTSAQGWASVSVLAETATAADGWSTALAVLPEAAGLAVLQAGLDSALQGAVLVRHDGSIVRIGSA